MANGEKIFSTTAKSSSGKEWKLNLICTYTQDINANKTNISAKLQVVVPSGVGSPYNKTGSAWCSIMGDKHYLNFSLSSGQTATLWTKSWPVSHNSNGAASQKIMFEWYTGLGSQWTPLKIAPAKAIDWTLPTIEKLTTIKTNTSTLVLKDKNSIKITLNRKNTKYYHTLYFKDSSGKIYTIADDVQSSTYSFTLDTVKKIQDLYAYLGVSGTSKELSLFCATYTGKGKRGHLGTSEKISVTIKSDKSTCGIGLDSISSTSASRIYKNTFFYNRSLVAFSVSTKLASTNVLSSFAEVGSITVNGASPGTKITLSSKSIKVIIKDKRGYSYTFNYTVADFANLKDYNYANYYTPTGTVIEVKRSQDNTELGFSGSGLIIKYSISGTTSVLSSSFTLSNAPSQVTIASENSNTIILKDSRYSAASEAFESVEYSGLTLTKTNGYATTANGFDTSQNVVLKVDSKQIVIFECDNTGFTLSVPLLTKTNQNMSNAYKQCGINMRNSDIIGINGLFFNDTMTREGGGAREGILFPRGADSDDNWGGAHQVVIDGNKTKIEMHFYDRLDASSGTLYFNDFPAWPSDSYKDNMIERKAIQYPHTVQTVNGNKVLVDIEDYLYKDYLYCIDTTGKVKAPDGPRYFSTYADTDPGDYYGDWLNGLPRSVPSIEGIFKRKQKPKS